MIEKEQNSIVLIGLFLCILIDFNCHFLLKGKVLFGLHITKAGLAINHQNGIGNLLCILKLYSYQNLACGEITKSQNEKITFSAIWDNLATAFGSLLILFSKKFVSDAVDDSWLKLTEGGCLQKQQNQNVWR